MDCFLGKRLPGKFMRDVSKVADARSWQWSRAGYLEKGTEGYVFAAQEQVLRTRFFRATIEREDVDPWYKKVPDEVRMSEDGKVEIWWDRSVETTRKFEYNCPDITVLDRAARRWTFVDFSVPWDKNVVSKEDEKMNNYSPLVNEITKLHRVLAKVVPLVVGCLGVVSCRLEQYLQELGIPDVLGGLQTSAVVGTTQILQKILGL